MIEGRTPSQQEVPAGNVTVDRVPGLRTIATKGAIVMGTSQAYCVVVRFVSNILLVRLLTPSDFGLIGMVGLFVAFISMLQNFGLNQATIQKEHISHAQLSALFWISVGSSAAFASAFAASAPLVAMFFGESRLIMLTWAFAGLVLLTGCHMQPVAYLNRHLQFKKIAIIQALSTTASAATGVTIAWITASYWAIFAASLASTLVTLLAVWALSGWRPGRPSFEGDFKEIFHFGSGVSGFNLVNYFSRNADNLLIGRFYGAEQLGYYDRAYKLLLFPLRQLNEPLGRVMLPVLSRLKNEPERYRNAYAECVALMMLAAQPGIVFLIVFADDVFLLLFGPQWLPAVPIFRWLGAFGLLQVMTVSFGWLYMSQGRGGDYFRIGVFGSVAAVASFVAGLPWGALGVAAAYTVIGYTLRVPITWWYLGRRGPVGTRHLLSIAFPHVSGIAASVGTLSIPLLTGWLLHRPGPFSLATLLAISYLTYSIATLAFPKKRKIIFHGVRLAGIAVYQLIETNPDPTETIS